MLKLDDMIIDERIFDVKFSCDLKKCKGACCTLEGTHGAPVSEDEIKTIEKILPQIKRYLPKESIKVLKDEGFYYYHDKEYAINTVNDNDCVFAIIDAKGVAKCSIQTAYYAGEVGFEKPISCALFPVRVSGKNGRKIVYEKLYECSPALDKGIEENITIFEFIKKPLIRKYGEQLINEIEVYKEENA